MKFYIKKMPKIVNLFLDILIYYVILYRLNYISNVFSYLIKNILNQNLTKVLGFSGFFCVFLIETRS